MMRLKLSNGVPTSAHIRYLVSVIREYGENGCADVITRQTCWDSHICVVVLPDVSKILKGLALHVRFILM
ncbi:hypothetical protein Bca101_042268 [Brassica carinata]